MDMFSRFHWLAPLARKKSRHLKKELQRIYKEHGQPERLQRDHRDEFKRQLKDYRKNRKIKMINFRPYNPKA